MSAAADPNQGGFSLAPAQAPLSVVDGEVTRPSQIVKLNAG